MHVRALVAEQGVVVGQLRHLALLSRFSPSQAYQKWLCAPKGAGFLWAGPALRDLLEPLIVSWDWERETEFPARHRWQGTRDPAACLAVPDAIDFLAEHEWDAVRARCHELAAEAQRAIAELAGVEPPPGPFAQMSAAELSPCDPETVQRRLREDHSIEVVCREWAGRPLIRASFQGYNDEGDLDRLLEALRAYESLTARR